MKIGFVNAATGLTLVLLATAPLSPATTPSLAAEHAAEGPPSSREILRQMSETLKAAPRIHFHAELAFDEPGRSAVPERARRGSDASA